jgi:hypothetical protein
VLVSRASGKGQHEIRRFGTMTRDLLELADWLQSQQVTHVGSVAKFTLRRAELSLFMIYAANA